MQSITPDAVIIGVDTRKETHVAVAIDGLGGRLGTPSIPVTALGYRQLADWARNHGPVHAFGIEGTGSYGAGLSRAPVAGGDRVVEVGRANRQLRASSARPISWTPRPPPAPFCRERPQVFRSPVTATSR